MEHFIDYNFNSTVCSQQVIFSQHCHTSYELIFVCAGEVSVNVEGDVYVLQKEHAILISPKTFHTVYSANTALYERLVVSFSEKFIPREIFDRFFETARLPLFIVSSASAAILKKLVNCAVGNNTVMRPLADALFIQFLYGIAFSDQANDRKERSLTSQMAEQITEVINQNLDKSLTLDFIANALYLSKSSVSHIFKSHMKTSVKQYVLNKKMTRAEELIKSGMSMHQVAKQCGYENYSAFYKIFLRIIGCPPSDKTLT